MNIIPQAVQEFVTSPTPLLLETIGKNHEGKDFSWVELIELGRKPSQRTHTVSVTQGAIFHAIFTQYGYTIFSYEIVAGMVITTAYENYSDFATALGEIRLEERK